MFLHRVVKWVCVCLKISPHIKIMDPSNDYCGPLCVHTEEGIDTNHKLLWTWHFFCGIWYASLREWITIDTEVLPFCQKREHKIKWNLVQKHTDGCDCTLCGLLHRCRSQIQNHKGENKRVVCYVSVSLVLLPVMHNECPRHSLSVESQYKLTRVTLTWPDPNLICVKAAMQL